ncbi:hypothetical protein LPJ61_006003, partial [Coemansia biformis]
NNVYAFRHVPPGVARRQRQHQRHQHAHGRRRQPGGHDVQLARQHEPRGRAVVCQRLLRRAGRGRHRLAAKQRPGPGGRGGGREPAGASPQRHGRDGRACTFGRRAAAPERGRRRSEPQGRGRDPPDDGAGASGRHGRDKREPNRAEAYRGGADPVHGAARQVHADQQPARAHEPQEPARVVDLPAAAVAR